MISPVGTRRYAGAGAKAELRSDWLDPVCVLASLYNLCMHWITLSTIICVSTIWTRVEAVPV